MRIKRTLLDDVEKVFYSIPCGTEWLCNYCKYDNLCETMHYLLKSLRKFY